MMSGAVVLCGADLFLRSYYGFCDTVLVTESPKYEYIAQPSQDRFRFRNNVKYNSLSMRSEEVDTTAILILGFGDSVINGGVQTDQESLATTILSDTLSKLYNRKLQFLNISMGSWGPDNCYAYLKEHGDLGAKHIFLFVSSHDAYDNMTFEKIVDHHESYPSDQYPSALVELMDRYLLPRIERLTEKTNSTVNELVINKKNENSVFNPGFASFLSYSREKNIPLTIYLHAEQDELAKRAYNDQGQEIIRFAKENDLPIIKGLENGLDQSLFRDQIHLNSEGQKKLAQTILNSFTQEQRRADKDEQATESKPII